MSTSKGPACPQPEHLCDNQSCWCISHKTSASTEDPLCCQKAQLPGCTLGAGCSKSSQPAPWAPWEPQALMVPGIAVLLYPTSTAESSQMVAATTATQATQSSSPSTAQQPLRALHATPKSVQNMNSRTTSTALKTRSLELCTVCLEPAEAPSGS